MTPELFRASDYLLGNLAGSSKWRQLNPGSVGFELRRDLGGDHFILLRARDFVGRVDRAGRTVLIDCEMYFTLEEWDSTIHPIIHIDGRLALHEAVVKVSIAFPATPPLDGSWGRPLHMPEAPSEAPIIVTQSSIDELRARFR